MDPIKEVDEDCLGTNLCKIYVQIAIDWDEPLIFVMCI